MTGVASADNAELIMTLGADRTIDYRTVDFTEEGRRYEVVFDTVAKIPRKRAELALVDGGRFVSTRSRRKENKVELETVRDLLEKASIRAVIDRRYSLGGIPDAHRYVELGRKKGNVVVIVDEGEDDA